MSRSDVTRAVFREFSELGLNTKQKLFDKAFKNKQYDVAAILTYNSQDTNILNKFLEILDHESIKALFVLDFLNRSVSNNPQAALITLQYLNNNTSLFHGNNTLHHGAPKKCFLEVSLEHGITIKEKNLEGNTPLHIAVESGIEPVKFLIENGSNIEEKNLEGNTPIHIALASENEKVIKYLVESGSNIEEKNLEGNTPIHIAVATQNNLMKFLIENGSNIEEKDFQGNTPIHIAAASDNDRIVKYLIQNGASTTQFTQNNDGQIPLELARHNNYIYRSILIDFLDYALKSSKFPSNEFQKQLSSR